MADNSSSSNPVLGLQDGLREIMGLSAVIILFIQAFMRLSPGPLPYTASTVIYVIAFTLLCRWRWLNINLEKPDREDIVYVRGRSKGEAKSQSMWKRLVEIVHPNCAAKYQMSYFRRVVELVILLSLIIFSLWWITDSLDDVLDELTGIPPMICTPSKDSDGMTIIVAHFDQVAGTPSLIEERTFDAIAAHLVGDMKVCSVEQVISRQIQAQDLGQKTNASIVVWGRIDAAFEVNLDVTGSGLSNLPILGLPSGEVLDNFSFQLGSPQEINVVTAFTISRLLYTKGLIRDAQALLGGALATAETKIFLTANDSLLVEPYFFLGFLYDIKDAPTSDWFQSIKAYSRAIEINPAYYIAYLNRAFVYKSTGRINEAISDYQVLIASPSGLAGIAHSVLAEIYVDQGNRDLAEREFQQAIDYDPLDPKGYTARGNAYQEWGDLNKAIADFETALKYDPENPYSYHDLGQAQIRAGQISEAMSTYQQAQPYLSPEDIEAIIEELDTLAEGDVGLQSTIELIKQALNQQ